MVKKYLAAGTMLVLSALVLWSYVFQKVVPFAGTYLGPDRIQYAVITMVTALAGFLLLWIARRKGVARLLRHLLFLLAVVLLLGWPLLALWGNTRTFRGFSWSLDTLLIGLLPVLILTIGLLIGCGRKSFALGASILFALLACLQLLALLKIAPRLGRAFSTSSSSEAIVYLAIALVSTLFAWIDFSYFRSGKSKA